MYIAHCPTSRALVESIAHCPTCRALVEGIESGSYCAPKGSSCALVEGIQSGSSCAPKRSSSSSKVPLILFGEGVDKSMLSLLLLRARCPHVNIFLSRCCGESAGSNLMTPSGIVELDDAVAATPPDPPARRFMQPGPLHQRLPGRLGHRWLPRGHGPTLRPRALPLGPPYQRTRVGQWRHSGGVPWNGLSGRGGRIFAGTGA